MTTGRKLFLSAGAALAMTVLMGGAALFNIDSLSRTIDKLARVEARKSYLAGDIGTGMAEYIGWERGIIARAYMNDKPTMEQYNQGFHDTAARLKKDIAEVTPLLETEDGRKIAGDLQTGIDAIERNHEPYWNQAASGQLDAAAASYRDSINPDVKQGAALAKRLVQSQNDVMALAQQGAGEAESRSRWIIVTILIVSVAVAIIAVWVIVVINRTLRQSVRSLSESASQVAGAAGQVSSASQSLARSSSDQAASIEETSASTEEINATAERNGESSRTAADMVTKSGERVADTHRLLDETVRAMNEINTSSDKISKINKVIDEIAFQTNILALNAAVEAARAGEAGMGFAVVADEVRNLAHRCSQAAKDTAGLIEESITRSRDGKTKVDAVAGAVRTMGEEAQQVKAIVDQVNVGSEEQSRGIAQIGQAIAQMEKLTQEAAATAEESAAAAEELNAQSTTLKDVADRLTAMVG
jgi:methyl-accepting chemotaxis protein/methyl-accepting chemotaxis protein-1 (serine sensor receptor)